MTNKTGIGANVHGTAACRTNKGITIYVHPELRAALEQLPEFSPFDDVVAARAMLEGSAVAPAPDARLLVGDILIPVGTAGKGVPARTYLPAGASTAVPVVVWFHGGGFALGGLDTEDATCRELAAGYDLAVVSIDYRLAPEHPYPAGFDDSYLALQWVRENAIGLGVDARRIGLGGHSSGAALAAAVALADADRNGRTLRYLYLGYPVLDDRPVDPRRSVRDKRLFNTADAELMWDGYIAESGARSDPYAIPARAADVTGLPSTYVMIGSDDPGVDAALAWTSRLLAADVPVELHIVPGAFHMFDVYAPDAHVTTRSLSLWRSAMSSRMWEGLRG